MRYGSCTCEEIARLAAAGALALVPLGCTEQQGPHLPVDFDSWFAGELAIKAAERVHAEHGVTVLVLPVIPIGPTPEHRSFGAASSTCPGLCTMRWSRPCSIRSPRRGSRPWSSGEAAAATTCGRPSPLTARPGPPSASTSPNPPFAGIWATEGDSRVPGGHADSFTTSIALARRPALVRLDRIPPPSRIPDWQDPDLDFGAYSDSGVIGDSRHASPELGERLWEASLAWVSRYLAAVAGQTDAGGMTSGRSNQRSIFPDHPESVASPHRARGVNVYRLCLTCGFGVGQWLGRGMPGGRSVGRWLMDGVSVVDWRITVLLFGSGVVLTASCGALGAVKGVSWRVGNWPA